MNNLGITKAEGRAALRELETNRLEYLATYGIEKLGGCTLIDDQGHALTVLALVASIAGVVDAKGEPK